MIPSATDPELEALLDYLKLSRGCDLTGYKRSTLMRRFRYRMQNLNIDSYKVYLQYLRIHSQEYVALLDTVLINVTSFFRDRDAWDYLATDIIPNIIASKQPNEPVRVWSAGCATGQEIYSLLILLAEALGIESCLDRVQCYATDVDEPDLQQARRGIYNELDIIDVPLPLVKKYFQETAQGYIFHPKLRRTVVFSHHDLAKDAPISRIDLLMCRNVLIYFNPEAQAAILIRFHFALKSSGFLFLGKSETLTNHRQILIPFNLKQRVYVKELDLELDDHLSIGPRLYKQQASNPPTLQSHFWQAAFEANPVAQVAVNASGFLVSANESANRLFNLTLHDWRRPFRELEPGKLLGSYATLASFYRNRYAVALKAVQWNTETSTRYFDVTIAPVFKTEKELLGITITFLEITDYKRLLEKLEFTQSELERTAKTLQVTESALNIAYIEQNAMLQDMQFLEDG